MFYPMKQKTPHSTTKATQPIAPSGSLQSSTENVKKWLWIGCVEVFGGNNKLEKMGDFGLFSTKCFTFCFTIDRKWVKHTKI
jgi:hypothetical protein